MCPPRIPRPPGYVEPTSEEIDRLLEQLTGYHRTEADMQSFGLSPAKGDLLVSGYGLVKHIEKVHCEHLVTVKDYHEDLTETSTLELAGFVPIWRKKTDRCGSDNKPAGGSLRLFRPTDVSIEWPRTVRVTLINVGGADA